MNETIEYSNLDQGIVLKKFGVFCSTSHSIVIILGIPLNMVIIVVMFSSQRLKKKPRNILFLGAILSSIFTLLTVMLELIASHHQNPEILCKISGLGSGVAYTCFLKNLLLALLDRYLAITRPLLHRKKVTIRKVRIIQAIGWITIFFLIKWPFIFGIVPFQCGFLIVEIETIALCQAILILLCVMLYILVYFKTKQYARPNRVISVSYVSNPQQSPDSDGGQVVNKTDRKSTGIISSLQSDLDSSRSIIRNKTSTELQVHGGSPRMEVF